MANVNSVKTQLATKKPAFDTIEDLLERSAKSLGQALPSHMSKERLNRIVLSMLRMSPQLQECTPISIVAAVFQMAQVGLEPVDGQAYIIPYANKKRINGEWKTVKEAQFQIGYKGYVSLFYRHNSSLALYWGVVCENDQFDFDKGANKLSHKINLRKERGVPYAYWVKAKLANGAEVFEVMSKLEVVDHAKKHSKAYNSDISPWKSDFDSMALKTVLKQLMKLLPKSVEIMKAVQMDETTKSHVDADMAAVPDETNWEDKMETIEIDKEIEVEGRKVLVASADVPDDLDMTPPPPAPKEDVPAEDLKNYKTDAQGRLIDPKTGKPI